LKRAAGGVAVLAFGVLLLVPGLGRMGAMDSTDARYLAIGREMWATGDWLVPRLAGVPHLDKPPLTYWAASLGYALFGPTEFGGRIVEQFALIATALVVYSAARRLAEPSMARSAWPAGSASMARSAWPAGSADWALPAALVFLTMGLPFALSRGLATDLFQLLFVTAALVALLDGATQRSSARVAAAGGLLGVSMLAKGPIGLLVVASIWLVVALCMRSRARLSWRGAAIGFALFAAIGVPWFALLVHRNPAILDWFAEVQLASRVTGTNRGHPKDATYLLRIWVLGLLPWTPIVALAFARLRPRGRLRDADLVDVFLLAWAIVPVLLFSLFPTKLGSYIAPAFPGTALLVARAGSRGLLDDRRARRTLAACGVLVIAAALGAGIGLLADSGFGFDLVPSLALHGSGAARVFGALLVAIGVLGLFALRRIATAKLPRAYLATACGAGLVLGLAFHGVADSLPTLRAQGRMIQSVPGARLVEFSLKPSLFFYADIEGRVTLATVGGVVDYFVDPAQARRLTLTREDALALLREDAPTFALIDDEKSAALASDTSAQQVSRMGRYVLLANPAAQRALAANPRGVP
jgi:4-amino-4-deoxy-L-arabinose transferase